jgi:hypothetical protein
VSVAALAERLATALDPAALARCAGIEPDGWQRSVLRSGSRRQLLNCSRQSGKSTIAAILAVHGAVYEPGSLQILLSPALRQSQELFSTCLGIYAAAGRPVETDAETSLSFRLANGSRIISLPSKEQTVRGYSGVRRLIVDEASRVGDDLFYAILPMLAVSGGSLLAMSTPFGKRGWWHDAWVNGGADWERVEVPATDCPRISPEFLQEQRRRMPARWFSQEFLCQFAEADDAVFRYDDIESAFTGSVEALPW